jgi:hypothetical protein
MFGEKLMKFSFAFHSYTHRFVHAMVKLIKYHAIRATSSNIQLNLSVP